MVNRLRRNLVIGVPAALALRPFAAAAQAPLRIEITEGVIEPMPFAVPGFVPDGGAAGDLAARITRVVADDLAGTGLFREIPSSGAHRPGDELRRAGRLRRLEGDQRAGARHRRGRRVSGDRAQVRFRLWDVFAQAPLGEGLQFDGGTANWRRLAHKVADAVYSRLTGEGGYFDSRVAFIAASGPKEARRKQLAIMDYDGANPTMLTDGGALVLTPRLAADARQVLYTSYEQGAPRVMLLEGGGRRRTVIEDTAGMTFAPRFSPNGRRVVYSASVGQGSDIFVTDLGGRGATQLTRTSSIDTAPAFSPDGNTIVFESDRGGTQQLYVMPASGGEARRISFGQGRYATPVWSPRGDMIAFTKIDGGRFHIGVMQTDGSGEKLLTGSYLDEGPTWAPNGRVLMFFRETPGAQGGPTLYSVDITGRNLKKVPTAGYASDPSWSGLLA